MENDYGTEFEDLLEAEGDYGEDDEVSTWEEAARPRTRLRPRPSLKTAPTGNAPIPRSAGGYALKSELDATARKLDARIATNGTALKQLEVRVRTGETESAKMGAALRKEIELRKKQTTELRRGIEEGKQTAMMMAIIGPMFEGDDNMKQMLPFLMYGGMFSGGSTSSASGGGMFGGDNSAMGMMMMAMALRPGA